MKQTTTNPLSFSQQQPSFKPSDEIIGFEKAGLLLGIGIACILFVLIFGIILCRLDMSSSKRHRSIGIYVEH